MNNPNPDPALEMSYKNYKSKKKHIKITKLKLLDFTVLKLKTYPNWL